jgi:hypothetical protein
MRGFSAAQLVFAIAASSCEVFVTDLGERGEPCAEDGSCYGELVCVFGTCTDLPGEGESCDDSHHEYDPFCADGLFCIDEECVEVGGPGQDCNPDVGTCSEDACDGSLFCVDDTCIAMGGEGEPCYCQGEAYLPSDCFVDCASLSDVEDPQCDDGLVCASLSYMCVSP